LKEQAEAMGLRERWHEIARTYADVNRAFGDIVKVTPSSKVVGDMALFLVTHDLTMQEFESYDEHHNLTIPNSVIEMFSGALGEPEGGWPKNCKRSSCAARSQRAGGRAPTCKRSILSRPPNRSRSGSASIHRPMRF
jgi:pyruvate carboxylase